MLAVFAEKSSIDNIAISTLENHEWRHGSGSSSRELLLSNLHHE